MRIVGPCFREIASNLDPTKLAAYPKLAVFKARIAERPRLSAYLTSSKRHPPFVFPS